MKKVETGNIGQIKIKLVLWIYSKTYLLFRYWLFLYPALTVDIIDSDINDDGKIDILEANTDENNFYFINN